MSDASDDLDCLLICEERMAAQRDSARAEVSRLLGVERDLTDDLRTRTIERDDERRTVERMRQVVRAARPVLQASGRIDAEAVLAMYPKEADDDR